MSSLDRIYRIHELLTEAHYPVPMARFTGVLEVSRTAINRDFQFMRDRLGAPIIYDRRHNGHQYDPSQPRFELPGFWLDASELFALLACEHLIEAIQPGIMTPHIAPLRERITRVLDASGHDASAIRERVCLQAAQIRGTNRHSFAAVAQATLEGKRLRLNYHARGSDNSSQRSVSPQRLCHYRSNWYLAAWCHQTNSLRMFSLDRIQNPEILTEPAQLVRPTELEPVIAGSFGIFTGTPTATAHLRFTPRAARWVAEETWHPSQFSEWDDQQHYHLHVPYADSTELLMDILRHGADVEVIGPDELRKQVIERVQEMVGVYGL